jgi:hypothetical protein
MKTSFPFVIVSGLWTIPLIKHLLGRSHVKYSQAVAGISLFLFEFVLPSVSTAFFAVFVCDDYGDGLHVVRAHPLLTCDPSDPRRRSWLAFSVFFALVYPVGAPLAILFILTWNRKNIKLLTEALQQQDTQSNTKTYLARTFARRESAISMRLLEAQRLR